MERYLNWKELSHHELIETIQLAQKELEDRGTITNCRSIYYVPEKDQKTEYITHDRKKES